uniref:Uncharacterized protein n=1 Tax=uncultured marine virus TaxID=186617 RepID=A0A0F7L758_9VIRU|nr:hypothetical protein [uncultured marine virus]
MPPRYPTYQRSAQLSASIVTPPNIDQAALREQAKGYASMAEGADRVMNFAFKEGEKRAKARGIAAGAADPTGTLEQFGGQRPVSNFEQQAAFDAAVGLASVEIETQARTAMQQTMLRYQKDKGNPQDLQQELNDIREGYASAIGDLDPLSAAKLNAKLTAAGQSLFLNYSADDLRVQEKERQAQGVTLYADAKRQADILGRQTGSDEDLATMLAYYTDSAEQLGQTGTPAFARGIETIKNDFHIARVRGAFEKSNDKEKFIEEFRDDLDTGTGLARGLFEGDKKTLGNEQLTWMRGDLAAKKRAATEAKQLLKAEISDIQGDVREINELVRQNFQQGQEKLERLEERAIKTGDPETIQNVRALQANVATMSYFRKASPMQMRAAATAFEKQANADRDVNPYEASRITMLRKMAEAAEAGLSKTADYHNEVNPEAPFEPITPDPYSMQTRVEAADDFAVSMGLQRAQTYLTTGEAENYGNRLEGANTDQQIVIFTELYAGFGKATPKVMQQIAKSNPIAARIGGMTYASGDVDFARQTLNGYNAMSPGSGLPGQTLEKENSDVIEAEIAKVMPNMPGDEYASVLRTAEAAVIGSRIAKAPLDVTKRDVVEKLVNQVLGAKYVNGEQFGGSANYNGRAVMVPNSVRANGGLEDLIKGQGEVQGQGRATYVKFNDGITAEQLADIGVVLYMRGKPIAIDDKFREAVMPKTFDGKSVYLTIGNTDQALQNADGTFALIDLDALINIRAGGL